MRLKIAVQITDSVREWWEVMRVSVEQRYAHSVRRIERKKVNTS